MQMIQMLDTLISLIFLSSHIPPVLAPKPRRYDILNHGKVHLFVVGKAD